MTESERIEQLLRELRGAEELLADLEVEVRDARERVRQARARYVEAVDRTQLALPLEEA